MQTRRLSPWSSYVMLLPDHESAWGSVRQRCPLPVLRCTSNPTPLPRRRESDDGGQDGEQTLKCPYNTAGRRTSRSGTWRGQRSRIRARRANGDAGGRICLWKQVRREERRHVSSWKGRKTTFEREDALGQGRHDTAECLRGYMAALIISRQCVRG